ncbi:MULTISPECIES: pseudouridine-5'-phosphate glycosidase [Chromohalobacter]|uniref:Pseudouridine-5'-phosphate glycosidase n=1 Tax=Chromohalobacter marismortui TaxID=42055 RepID=A0A4R7NSL7_9GAMM|nr:MULTISPECIES: pseudouridine-5'-phosphate glycosidase [Chromohalobacter]MCI0509066.1 pseudouridine-5'-phosphate glycosidase [Chromohalobacter sp.]MCI0592829.1 pseudouridine-5'-phosphate glycosidase [Chromohalobacter sp.]MCK0745393.1 pseudouridine-5'-phosphate glycosidase [Chromohalobacter nigrandesensis]TDU24044.1 pseudouridine-5'-phosphate glycosidase [Chromohalobacter marismortui]
MRYVTTHGDIPLTFNEEVADALAGNRPVVALESNVITHGLRYPLNIETALAVENAVRRGGAVPATIFIDEGKILVGSDQDRIERFASLESVPKVSSRDLPVALAKGGPGATTVASSLVCAELAGVEVFSSAGIGGVHRGAERSMDISADLVQFTRSRVAVVCAGAKSILDLELTLEFLETHCVPLLSYRSDDFPAFFCDSSGLRSPNRIDDLPTLARAILAHWASGAPGGPVITTPPRPEDALPRAEVESVITDALQRAETEQISGNGLTKFLMRAIEQATEGRSAQANAAVLVSTAELAGEVAASLQRESTFV